MEVPEGSCPQDKSPAGHKNFSNSLFHPPYDHDAARLVKNLSYQTTVFQTECVTVCTYRDNLNFKVV